MSIFHSRFVREVASTVFVLSIFTLPVFVWAGNTKKVYVDDSATGMQNGSSQHPYKTISEGLKHVNNDDELHVAKGIYRENIEIPEGVEMFGEDEDATIIEASSDNDPAVIMHHKTMLDKFTVKGGSHGVYVAKDSRASIIHCIVRDSDKDGIHVRSAKVSDKYAVSIVKSDIRANDRAGIFSERRKVVIIDSTVRNNDSDGADLAAGSQAWIDDNNFRDNRGSGLKVSLDGSSVFVASRNTFRDNKHEGLEVNAYGKTGIVNVKSSRFINNAKYGIARIERGNAVSQDVWKGLTETNSMFSSNNDGNISPILEMRK